MPRSPQRATKTAAFMFHGFLLLSRNWVLNSRCRELEKRRLLFHEEQIAYAGTSETHTHTRDVQETYLLPYMRSPVFLCQYLRRASCENYSFLHRSAPLKDRRPAFRSAFCICFSQIQYQEALTRLQKVSLPSTLAD